MSEGVRLVARLSAFAWGLLIVGLWYLQVVRGNYYARLSLRNFVRIVPIPAVRGDILDRKFRVLATSAQAFDLAVNPQAKDKERAFALIAKWMGITQGEVKRRYERNYVAPFLPVVVARDLPKRLAFRFAEVRPLYPQITIQVRPKRIYPYGPMTAHILGYVGEIDRRRLQELKDYGYRRGDRVGYMGVEEYYDAYLRGRPGWVKMAVDKMGRPVKVLEERDPVKGESLVLSIDLDLQSVAFSRLKGKVGTVIFADPFSGEVLAMVNWPSYDDNLFVSSRSTTKRTEVLTNPLSPMLNRAISGVYPPGSTFKIVVAIGGLDAGVITPRTTFFCPGYMELGGVRFGCTHAHGKEDLVSALGHSCNVYFYNLGLRLGSDGLFLYGSRFGLGSRTGIDLPGEKTGLLPSKEWKRQRYRQAWYDGDTLNLSIGQGYILATPIQMLRVVSAVANGGWLVKPFLAKYSGKVRINSPEKRDLMLDEEDIDLLRRGLESAVTLPDGTARVLYYPDLKVAGKTGTAQSVPGKPAHGWFVGYFPARAPRYAVAVLLEYGKSSYYACQLLREIIDEMRGRGL